MKQLKGIINKFHKAKILVVGDLILDEYIWGDVERISPEAPVPVVWASRKTYVPGGAANVASNIRSLGAKVSIVGVIGQDRNKDIFLAELRKRKIPLEAIFTAPKRHTTVKTRIIAKHQQALRVDWEHTDPLPSATNLKINRFIKKNIADFDAIIIEDYGKGVVNAQLLQDIIILARSHNKVITIDPKEEHFQYYRAVSSITPNRRELENAVRDLKIRDTQNKFKINSDVLSTDKDIVAAGKEVVRYLGLDSLLVTLGERGMRLFEKNGQNTHIPTVAQEVFDVSGAGDTVIATFTLALSCGATKLEAAHIANFAAGIVVGKVGTAVTTREELLKTLHKVT